MSRRITSRAAQHAISAYICLALAYITSSESSQISEAKQAEAAGLLSHQSRETLAGSGLVPHLTTSHRRAFSRWSKGSTCTHSIASVLDTLSPCLFSIGNRVFGRFLLLDGRVLSILIFKRYIWTAPFSLPLTSLLCCTSLLGTE